MKAVYKVRLLVSRVVQVGPSEILTVDNDFQLPLRTFQGLKCCFDRGTPHYIGT